MVSYSWIVMLLGLFLFSGSPLGLLGIAGILALIMVQGM